LLKEDHHFVDSNMVIGLTVDWDDPNDVCSSYFEKAKKDKQHIYTSKRVKEEIENVLETCRRKIKQAIFKIHKDFNYISSQTLEKDLKGFLRKHFGNLKSVVINYMSYRLEEIRDLIKNPQKLDAKLDIVDRDIDEPVNFLYKVATGSTILNYFADVPENHSQFFHEKWKKVSKMLHTKDANIIMDAYHIVENNGVECMVFLSLDRDFTKNGLKNKIEETLSGLIVYNLQDVILIGS